MKAIIQEVVYKKEFETKFGTMHTFHIKYDNVVAVYNSKDKNQTKFVTGKEAEFTEETKTYKTKDGEEKSYIQIKPPVKNGQSNFGKALTKEQARYSAMCVSYAKDLVIGGRIPLDELSSMSWTMFELIKEMDKTLKD